MISIKNEQSRFPSLSNQLRYRANRVLKHLGLGKAEVDLLLCTDETIRRLNAEWRSKDQATDVLSFPLHDFKEEHEEGVRRMLKEAEVPILLGDVIISVDTCARQARKLGHPVIEEATRLWIHGFLHLCGYDHLESEDAELMKRRESELLGIFRGKRPPSLVQY